MFEAYDRIWGCFQPFGAGRAIVRLLLYKFVQNTVKVASMETEVYGCRSGLASVHIELLNTNILSEMYHVPSPPKNPFNVGSISIRFYINPIVDSKQVNEIMEIVCGCGAHMSTHFNPKPLDFMQK